MKESKRRPTVLIMITIAAFILIVIGATYAYFQSNFNIDARIELGVTTAKQVAFTSSTKAKLAQKLNRCNNMESRGVFRNSTKDT